VVGREVFVGQSRRTNRAACAQLTTILARFDYRVTPIEVRGALHLKSAATSLGGDLVLCNPRWLPPDAFDAFDRVAVDPAEPAAANALAVERRVIYSRSFPSTLDRLQRRGLAVDLVDNSEAEKAEGAVTCCSLLLATKL
jgi:dimethylargininase